MNFLLLKERRKKKQNYTKIELFFHCANKIFNKLYMTRIRDQKFDNSHKYKQKNLVFVIAENTGFNNDRKLSSF